MRKFNSDSISVYRHVALFSCAEVTSEMSVHCRQTTRRHFPEDTNLRSHSSHKVKSPLIENFRTPAQRNFFKLSTAQFCDMENAGVNTANTQLSADGSINTRLISTLNCYKNASKIVKSSYDTKTDIQNMLRLGEIVCATVDSAE